MARPGNDSRVTHLEHVVSTQQAQIRELQASNASLEQRLDAAIKTLEERVNGQGPEQGIAAKALDVLDQRLSAGLAKFKEADDLWERRLTSALEDIKVSATAEQERLAEQIKSAIEPLEKESTAKADDKKQVDELWHNVDTFRYTLASMSSEYEWRAWRRDCHVKTLEATVEDLKKRLLPQAEQHEELQSAVKGVDQSSARQELQAKNIDDANDCVNDSKPASTDALIARITALEGDLKKTTEKLERSLTVAPYEERLEAHAKLLDGHKRQFIDLWRDSQSTALTIDEVKARVKALEQGRQGAEEAVKCVEKEHVPVLELAVTKSLGGSGTSSQGWSRVSATLPCSGRDA